jgi:hypothetical protein
MPPRQIKISAFIRGTFIFCFLGLIIAPVLVRADDRDHGHMVTRLNNLEDKDPYIRRCAAIDLGLYDRESKDDERKEVIMALKRHLHDTDKLVRYSAAEALVDIDTTSKEILPILIEELKDKTVNPITAALSLRHFGPEAREAVPILIDLMKKEGIDYSWGYPISQYGDVLREIGTPEALAAVEPLRKRELIAKVFYAAICGPFVLLMIHPVLPLLTALCFAGLFWWSRAQYRKGKKISHWPLIVPILGWIYVAYALMGGFDRIGYFLLSILTTLIGVIPWLASWLRVRAQEKRKAADTTPSGE